MSSYLDLAKKTIEESSSAKWDPEWAHELCKKALAPAAALYTQLSREEQDAADLESAEAEWVDRCNAAAKANDPAAFRVAVKGWERALVETLEAARMGRGTA